MTTRLESLRDWQEARNWHRGLDGVIGVYRTIQEHDEAGVALFRRSVPYVPVAIAADICLNNLRALARMPAVTGYEERGAFISNPTHLVELLNRESPMCAAINIINEADHISSSLRAALICLLRRPVRNASVSYLANQVWGYSTQTLRREWRLSTARGTSPRDFVDWTLILHARALGHEKRNAESLADALGVDLRALRRAAAKQLGSSSIQNLREITYDELHEKLHYMLRPRASKARAPRYKSL